MESDFEDDLVDLMEDSDTEFVVEDEEGDEGVANTSNPPPTLSLLVYSSPKGMQTRW